MKVTLPSRTIKAMAWESCKTKYWFCLGIAVVGTILSNGLSLIVGVITNNEFVLTIVDVIELVLEVFVSVGLARFFLNVFRGENVSVDTFTDGFSYLKKALVMEIIAILKTFLWSLLFVIPGIIYAIGNEQMYRILIDNPDLSPMECINKSQDLMKGNKWKYIKLQLSFFGGVFLASLPATIYTSINGPKVPVFSVDLSVTIYSDIIDQINNYAMQTSAFNNQPIMILLNALPIFVTVYILMANTCFYDILTENLVVTEGNE